MTDVAVDAGALFPDGLSRIDRTGDNSGYAFTALDIIEKGLDSLEPIRSFPHLMFVNVSKNKLQDAEPLNELTYLMVANLSENQFTVIPKFKQPHLKDVDLSRNSITTLQEVEGPSLVSLKLIGNQISTLDGLGNLTSLKYLDISRNDISSILLPNEMGSIQELALSENKITSLVGVETTFPNIVKLVIDLNQIPSFEAISVLPQLTQLSELDLTGNSITEVENYRLDMLLLLPKLFKLDGIVITDDERIQAIELKRTRDAAVAAAEE